MRRAISGAPKFEPGVSTDRDPLTARQTSIMWRRCCVRSRCQAARRTTPQDFVLLAETVGLASELDLAVADMACDAAVRSGLRCRWRSTCPANRCRIPAFRDRLIAKLIAHPARKAKKLAVEMTETAQLGEYLSEGAQRRRRCCAIWAFPFCLDDFGSQAPQMSGCCARSRPTSSSSTAPTCVGHRE